MDDADFFSAKLGSLIELVVNINNNYQLIYLKNTNTGIILVDKANSAPWQCFKFAEM